METSRISNKGGSKESDKIPQLRYIDDRIEANKLHIMHQHDDIMEILLIRSGNGIFTIDGQRYSTHAGDVLIFNVGVVHDEIPNETDCNNAYAHSCIGISNYSKLGFQDNCILPEHYDASFSQPKEFNELDMLSVLMKNHISRNTFEDNLLCQQLLPCFLALIDVMIESQSNVNHINCSELVENIKQYIDFHYAEPFSLETLGELFHVSPFHLSHLFKRELGYSIKQYIIRRRIGEAQSLLKNPMHSITYIATQVGFGDSSHFDKIFTKQVGITPSTYRKFRRTM